MRSLCVLLTFGVVACTHPTAPTRPTPAQNSAHQDTSHAASGRVQAPEVAAKPYNQVITPGAVTDSGVFIVHRIGEKLFYEIPRAMFGNEFLLVADQRGTMRGIRYAGEEISTRIVVCERLRNTELLSSTSGSPASGPAAWIRRAPSSTGRAPSRAMSR